MSCGPARLRAPVYLRNVIRKPPTARDVADHTEVLAILSEMARAGKVTAAIALERALRDRHDDAFFDDDPARILGD